MVRSHPEPPASRSKHHSPLPCSSAGEQAVDNRQVVRSIRTTATSFIFHAPVAEPGYARVSETRVHSGMQVRPLPGAPFFQSRFVQSQRSKQRGRNSANQSTWLLTGESMGSSPSARTSVVA